MSGPGADLYEFVYNCVRGVATQPAHSVVTGALRRAGMPEKSHVVQALTSTQLRSSSVRLVESGITLSADALQRSGSFNSRRVDDLMSYPRLRSGLNSGSTVIVDDIARWFPYAHEISRRIFNERWLHSNACFYLTGPRHAGLPLHADEEHTFVIQIAGRKRWQVEERRSASLGAAARTPGAGLSEFVLKPGDVAWIPERFPHATTVEGDDTSVHMTLGVRRFNATDLWGGDHDSDRITEFRDPADVASRAGGRKDLVVRALGRSIAITSGLANWECGLYDDCTPVSSSLWHVGPIADYGAVAMLGGVVIALPAITLTRLLQADTERVQKRLPWPDYVALKSSDDPIGSDVIDTLRRTALVPPHA
jgi:hypothetical protein